MRTNSIIIGLVILFAIILVVFLVRRNWKDEKELETFLNEKDTPLENDGDEDELNNSN